MAKYDIFISYRREGGYETAKHLYDLLTRDGYTVSFDIDTLRSGDFDISLLKRIEECQDFILIIDAHAFDRTLDPNFDQRKDWLRQELAHALKKSKNIIPIFLNGVEKLPDNLPGDIAGITKKNSPQYNQYYFDAFYDKIKTSFLLSRPRPVNPNPVQPKPKPQMSEKLKKSLLWGGGGVFAVIAIILLISFWPKEDHDNTIPPPPTPLVEGLHYDESTAELVDGSNRYKMLEVDGGSFYMGATAEQKNTGIDENPEHRVKLSTYHIGETEVPQWLWKAVMGSNPSSRKGDNLPVEYVSWEDCKKFINKLNTLTGKNFRFPTEAQWEYAARGGRRSCGYQYSGSDDIDSVAWHGSNSNDQTHEVGTKKANELGLYDMSGNVYEWCSDWYGEYPDSCITDPAGLISGTYRVRRGGGYSSIPRRCRVSYRDDLPPDRRSYGLGLRLALD